VVAGGVDMVTVVLAGEGTSIDEDREDEESDDLREKGESEGLLILDVRGGGDKRFLRP
jgi:hypothetical protein